LYKNVPSNLFYPITQQKNITRYTLTENYIKNLLKKSLLKNSTDPIQPNEAVDELFLNESKIKECLFETISPNYGDERISVTNLKIDSIV